MSNKILYFEGAGCVPCGDVANCRIRTAFANNDGKKIYLEMCASEKSKYTPTSFKMFNNCTFILNCHYITTEGDDENKNRINVENKHFEYTYNNILNFVNKTFNCNFNSVVVLNNLAGYRVHKNNDGYNFGDEFKYSTLLEKKRQDISDYVYNVEQLEGRKYPNFSIWIDDDDIHKLHILRHFNGYNKHYIAYTKNHMIGKDILSSEEYLGKYGC